MEDTGRSREDTGRLRGNTRDPRCWDIRDGKVQRDLRKIQGDLAEHKESGGDKRRSGRHT
jgi:hypothetical protein